jgi:TolA-binding protein
VKEQQRLLKEHDYQGAYRQGEKALALTPDVPPGDEALFRLGVIEASAANPQRDDRQALEFLQRVVQDFPHSDSAASAAAWIPLLEERLSAERQGRLHLQRVRRLLAAGKYAEAQKESEKLLGAPAGGSRDAALFGLGLTLADPANPGRDGSRARDAFDRMVSGHPESPYAQEGRIWRAALDEELSEAHQGTAILQRVRGLIRAGDYQGAARAAQGAAGAAGPSGHPPESATLFALALVYADRGNPRQDLKKAIGSLNQLVREHADSPFAEDARIWLASLKAEASPEREAFSHLQRVRQLLRKGDFEGGARECQRVLSSGGKGSPADAALYGLGLLYADPANPLRDYRKSAAFLGRLRREHPASPYAEEARVLLGVLATMEKTLRVDLEIEEKKNELKR